MTCIVGIVDKKSKSVVMGADSAGTSGNDIVIRKDAKIFWVGPFLIGCTTSFRMIQLLRYSLKLPDVPVKGDIYEYMCTSFINAVRECLKLGGYMERENEAEVAGTFLVGYKGRLFRIQHDLNVGENINGISACGCGAEYAVAAVLSAQRANSLLSPYWLIKNALQVAESFSAGVAGPFKILST